MKKIFSKIMVLLLIVSSLVIFGCNERYGDLKMSLNFCFSSFSSKTLNDGTRRWTNNTDNSVVDEMLDGSYTLYISGSTQTTAYIDATFSGVPEDFNSDVQVSLSNSILTVGKKQYIDGGMRVSICAKQEGSTTLTVLSSEGSKQRSLMIQVVEVPSVLRFRQGNVALSYKRGTTYNISSGLENNLSLRNMTFDLGTLSGAGETNIEKFVPFSSLQLASKNISLVESQILLLEDYDLTDDEVIYARATYKNPLGEDLVQIQQIEFLPQISNFEIYSFDSTKDNGLGQKVGGSEEDLLSTIDFVTNIAITHKDFVLKTNTYGKKINIIGIQDSLCPFSIFVQPNYENMGFAFGGDSLRVRYFNADGEITTAENIGRATYGLSYIRLVPSKIKSTEGSASYPDGTYNMNFECSYVDYPQEEFLSVATLNTRCYTVVNNYSVNGNILQNNNILTDFDEEKCYSTEVMTNFDASLGVKLSVEVGDPLNVLKSRSVFGLTFYRRADGSSTISRLNESEVLNIFQIFVNDEDHLLDANFSNQQFPAGTDFYFKIKQSGEIFVGDDIFVQITSIEDDSQAECVAKLSLVQGIREITGFEVVFRSREIDEATGDYIIFDTQNISFESNKATLDLDLSKDYIAIISLQYSPIEATLSNIYVSSLVDNVVLATVKNGNIILDPKSVGRNISVSLGASNLRQVYSLNVNVYYPVLSMEAEIVDISSNSSIGDYSIGTRNVYAKVKTKEQVEFMLTTRPYDANRYNLTYAVYNITSGSSVQVKNSYTIYYDGSVAGANKIYDEYFELNCTANAFRFTNDSAEGKTYVVEIVLENLDGTVLTWTFTLFAFVPVEEMDINLSRAEVVNPKTVAYETKLESGITFDTQNPPDNVFGFNVTVNKTSSRVPTNTFEEEATVTISIGGRTDGIYQVSGGVMSKISEGESVVRLLYPGVFGGKYWFELQDNVDSSYTTIQIGVRVNEYRNYHYATKNISIVNHEQVTEIYTNAQTTLKLRDTDILDDISFSLEIGNEKASNKTLLVQNLSIVEVGGNTMYLIAGEGAMSASIQNQTNMHSTLSLLPTGKAGKSILVVMPQDKIVTREQYETFCGTMTSISLTLEDFVDGMFYEKVSDAYEIAHEYQSGKQYYAKVVNYAELIKIWKGALTIQIDIENGEDVPYSISSMQDLLGIAQNPTKNYILANNIRFDNSKTFSPISSYYPVELTEDEFNKGIYYSKNNADQYILQTTYSNTQTYYAYGFGGSLVGKNKVQDRKTGESYYEYYSIENVYLPAQINQSRYGLFEVLYGTVSDVTIKYAFAQPTINVSTTFGGIAGVNFGRISNCTAQYTGAIFRAEEQIVFGGVAGVNFGEIEQNTQQESRLNRGDVEIIAKGENTLLAGGIVGFNFGDLSGSYSRQKGGEVSFGNSAYDSSLNIKVSITETSNSLNQFNIYSIPSALVTLFENYLISPDVDRGGAFLIPQNYAHLEQNYNDDTSTTTSDGLMCGIGGVVGINIGKVHNISVQSVVDAQDCDFVGGIVGLALSSELYNSKIGEVSYKFDDNKYSIYCSYSSSKVTGNHYVGGAVGGARGILTESNTDIPVAMYDVGAENYVNDEHSRNFVVGKGEVGGFAGRLVCVVAHYLSTTSYYDEYSSQGADWLGKEENYDIMATATLTSNFELRSVNDGLAGGFAGCGESVRYYACGANVNVWAPNTKAGYIFAFTSNMDVYFAENIFGKGVVYSNNNTNKLLGVNSFGSKNTISYSKITDVKNIISGRNGTIYSINGSEKTETEFTTLINSIFNENRDYLPWKVEKDTAGKIAGLPMLYITYKVDLSGVEVVKSEPLFVLGPVVITATVKDNLDSDEGWKFVKLDDKTIMLFFALSESDLISTESLLRLNTTSLLDLLNISVSPSGVKSNKLKVQSNSDLLEISGENIIIKSIGREGSSAVTLTVSSNLSSTNPENNAKIDVILCYGLTDVNVYANTSFTMPLNEDYGIDLLLSQTQTVYANPEYIVNVDNEDVSLRAMENVGLRFEVLAEDVNVILDSLNGTASGIGNIFTIASKQWTPVNSGGKVEKYYVNVDSTFASFVPLIAIPDGGKLAIECIPYIYQTINGERKTALLQEHSTHFYLSITHGATAISLLDNMQPNFVMNQLQKLAFTITMDTDSIDDRIILDNAIELGKELGINIGEYQYEFVDETGKIQIVGSSDVRGKTGLRKISQSYTVWFKDKLSGIKEDKNYIFNFHSNINTTIALPVAIKIIGENEVKSVYTNVYASYDDFPQKSSGGYIYSGLNDTPAVLGVEVYPYVTNYSHVRLSYTSTSGDLLFITPVILDLNNEHGKQFVDNGSVAVYSSNGKTLTINKSIGQDTFLSNNSGVYSYARSYFFKLFTDSHVKDGTEFVVKIDILNEAGAVILSKSEVISTLKKPGITFALDNDLLGNDGKYYVPINTKNELIVDTINYNDEIKWELSAVDVYGNAYSGFSDYKEGLEPKKEGSKYYIQLLNFEEGIWWSTDLVGKTITLRGEITSNKQTYSYEIQIVVTMFTVKEITVDKVENGSINIPVATTYPLRVNIEAFYDDNIKNSGSWYEEWYNNIYLNNKTDDSLYINIIKAGYQVKRYFVDYINELADNIAKATFSSSSSDSKVSGVWQYNAQENLISGSKYNDETFGVETFNDFFALYGLKTDKQSNILFDAKIAYTANKTSTTERASGIPNVKDYSTIDGKKEFKQAFVVTFVYPNELKNAIPVSTAEEFLSMKEGGDYRLVNDIVLSNYRPLTTNIASFDGNNKVIFITGFSYDYSTTGDVNLGLFEKIEKEVEVGGVAKQVLIENVTVYYTPSVTQQSLAGTVVIEPSLESLRINLPNASSVTFGGLTCSNAGVIANANILGGVRIEVNSSDVAGASGSASSNIGGLVANNEKSGYISNSTVGAKLFRKKTTSDEVEKVYDGFNIYCYGNAGGVVCTNRGKIVASYFESGSIEHNSKQEGVGGFVCSNYGEILESYVQGRRAESDKDIRNTGSGMVSRAGIVGGFVYYNSGVISDCYSNIWLTSSGAIAGFVYEDTAQSVISRCYSISYKKAGDNNTMAYPFAGPRTLVSTEVCINGVLNDCFFLNDKTKNDKWENTNFYTPGSNDPSKTPANKKAVELSISNFATHTYFTNYDLSLVYYSDKYANEESYNYVDGYTWAIIEGKPVIASTLVRTISQRDYLGKKKKYKESREMFAVDTSSSDLKSTVRAEDKSITDYTSASTGKLLFSTRKYADNSKIEFIYNATENFESLVITYEITNIEGKQSYVNPVAEYGESKRVLDVQENSIDSEQAKDNNFRANDTIVVVLDLDRNLISNITYYVLDEKNITYYYKGNDLAISKGSGDRSNPITIYDKDSLVYAFTNSVGGEADLSKYFRIVSDIDLDGDFLATSKANFTGVLQGNHMTISNLSMSYDRWSSDQVDRESFGMFAKITAGTRKDTIISNLKIGVLQIASNVHTYVGGLAGQIVGSLEQTANKVLLNNVSVVRTSTNNAPVQGRNIVGGLTGLVRGNVILKDIVTDVSVVSTYDASSTSLYINPTVKNNCNACSYVGGVVGVFDATPVVDNATKKNYNASNISVLAGNMYYGGIVGTAFGLLGKDTIANYVNVQVETSSDSFIKSKSYAGGIVGENRGTLLSSSAKNIEESESTVSIGSSSLVEYSYFFNGDGTQTLAIGGLVGLNNGGLISNALSAIDVRSSRTVIAGGAVGRQLSGGIENVIASGSVFADKIIGGLIGTINDKNIMTSQGGFSDEEDADACLMEADSSHLSLTGYSIAEDSYVLCRISNSVAENNWLYDDYSRYIQKINSSTRCAIGGFIGLIATEDDVEESRVNATWQDKVIFDGKSAYVGKISDGVNSRHIKSVYVDGTFDYPKNISDESYEFPRTNDGEQALFPYSLQELLTSAQTSDLSYSVEKIPFTAYSDQSSIGDEYISTILKISNNPGSIKQLNNEEGFYKEIKVVKINGPKPTDTSSFEDGVWYVDDSSGNVDFDWLAKHFGIVYFRKNDDSRFEEVVNYTNLNNEEVKRSFNEVYCNEESDDSSLTGAKWLNFYKQEESNKEYGKFYYIANSTLSTIRFDRTYTYKSDGKVQNEIALIGASTDNRGDGINSFKHIENLFYQSTFVLNGVCIFDFDINKSISEGSTGFENLWSSVEGEGNLYTLNLDNCKPAGAGDDWIWSVDLPDGGTIVDIKIRVESSGDEYYVSEVILSYEYNGVVLESETSNSAFIKETKDSNNPLLSSYSFISSAKKTSFRSFSSEYWIIGEDFYSQSVSFESKYPKNIEFAETYVWEDFRTKNVTGRITEINTAEDLALFAYLVNSGTDYTRIEVKLKANIDLSGKYWVPIGKDEAHAFNGTFTGNGYTIKYVSVDENSLAKTDEDRVVYAGIFGYVKNATITGLTLIGGKISGETAGGLVGYADNVQFNALVNRNNVMGDSYVGGLVGYAKDCSFENCTNYAEVKNTNNYNSTNVYVGGIAGKMDNGNLKTSDTRNDKGIQNYGVVYAQESHNNHFGGTEHLVNVWLGGLVGSAGSVEGITINTKLSNFGKINANSNATELRCGGLFGYLESNSCSSLFNKGIIKVANFNRNTTDERSKMYVGGVCGQAECDMSIMANEQDITVTCDLASNINSNIGGIVGALAGNINQSYNAKNISYVSKDSDIAYVGGLIGLSCISGHTYNEIVNCYNAGKITTTCGGVGSVAGIVGLAEENCGLIVQNTLSIGQILAQNGRVASNVGAITNFTEGLMLDPSEYPDEDVELATFANFYLRGVAVVGSVNATAVGGGEVDESGFAQSKIAKTLKDAETYESEGKPLWNFSVEEGGIWEWKYSTWFPTLKKNSPNTLWTDSIENMVQVGGDYVIDTAEQLANLAYLVNSGMIDTKGKVFRLRDAIDLSNKLWIPIGNEEFAFEGTFEGGGYSIFNMTVDGSAVEKSGIDKLNYGGLFGVVKNAKIANIGIMSPIVRNVNYATSVAVKATNSLITNVYTEKDGSNTCKIVGDIKAGGLVCELINSKDQSNTKLGLHKSYNNVPVEANTGIVEKIQTVGALVATLTSSSITNCYNGENGSVTIAGSGISESIMVVGSIGSSSEESILTNVFNLCTNADGSVSSTPAIYEIADNVVKKVDGENSSPIFDNLQETSTDGRKSSVWAKEYSLNSTKDASGNLYPSLRGVGLEWKNTECDTLLSFDTNSLYKGEIRSLFEGSSIMFADEVLGEQELSSKDSSINRVYLIQTAQELAWLSLAVNSGMLTSHCEFILMADIDLAGRFFTPIGSSQQNAFCGVFNFNGHTIKNLTIDSLNYTHSGLFAITQNAYIINGYIKDAFIKVENSSVTTNLYAGTLVGLAYNTTIKNITVSTAMLIKGAGRVYVGGLAGHVSGSIQYEIQNVMAMPSNKEESIGGQNHIDLTDYHTRIYEEDIDSSTASKLKDVSINIGAISLSERVFAGGLIGLVHNYDSTATSAGMTYCTNMNNVVAMSVGNQPANVYGGGVVGYLDNQMVIEACYNTGSIKTSSTLFDAVGGIVGYTYYGTLRNCLSTGYVESCLNSAIKGESSSGSIFSYIGGIVGIAVGGTITNTISQSTTYQDVLTGKNIAVGGVVGYMMGKNDFTSDINVLFEGVGNFGSINSGVGLSQPIVNSSYNMGLDGKFNIDDKVSNGFVSSYWAGSASAPILKAQKAYVALTSDYNLSVTLKNKTLNTESSLTYERQGNNLRGLLASRSDEFELVFAKDEEVKKICLSVLDTSGVVTNVEVDVTFTGEQFVLSLNDYIANAVSIFVRIKK
ncbi:MAG: hypothetical protein ACI4L7_02845 [Christensenellales bacterium]